jgi:hypothetical protein
VEKRMKTLHRAHQEVGFPEEAEGVVVGVVGKILVFVEKAKSSNPYLSQSYLCYNTRTLTYVYPHNIKSKPQKEIPPGGPKQHT